MENKAIIRVYRPILLVFIGLVLVFFLIFSVLTAWGIDPRVLLTGNLLLFLATTASFFLYIKGLRNQNPHAFVRVMYGSLLIKFFVCLVAVLIYAMVARGTVNRNGIFGCFILYLLYTVLEVRTLVRLSKKPANA
jgi:hypothetical protein